jgi:RNA polymerase sigma factor (sigma-70 family)
MAPGTFSRLFRRTLCRLHSTEAPTDAQLLLRFSTEHDEAAFTELVRRHGPMVLAVCRRVLHHFQDAEDAFQASFIVLAKKAAAVANREAVGGWLHGVAYRVALNARKTLASRRDAAPTSLDDVPQPVAPANTAGRDLRLVLDEELNRLPEKYRAPVVLCYLEGRTNDEAARQLRWPIGTVKIRLTRAREVLRDRLGRRGLALSVAGMGSLLGQGAATAGVRASLVRPFLHAASLLADGKNVAGISANARALAASVVTALAWGKIKQVTSAAALVALVALAGVTTAHALFAPRTPATVAQAMAPGKTAAGNDVQGQLQNFANVIGASATNGIPTNPTSLYYFASGIAIDVPGTGNIRMLRNLANNNLQVIQQSGTATITLGPRTTTTQQVIITSPGNMFILNTATDQVLGKLVPVQMTMIINLTATAVPNTPTHRVCTMTFRAFNSGQQVYAIGPLKGNSIAYDHRWRSAAPLAAAQARPGWSPALLSGLR